MERGLPGGWSVFDATGVPLAALRRDGRLTRANPALSALLGWPTAALTGRDLLAGLAPEAAAALRAELAALAPDAAALDRVLPVAHADGRRLRVRVEATALPDTELVLLTVADVTVPALAAERAGRDGHDRVTGLPTRARLEHELARTLAEGRRHGSPATLVLVGLDAFGAWVAANGEQAGDRILRFAAATASARVRAEDMVARAAPDQLAILLRHATLGDARGVAAEVVGLLAGDEGTGPGASAGVVALEPSLADPLAALAAADLALATARARPPATGDGARVAAHPGGAPAAPPAPVPGDRLLDGLRAVAMAPGVGSTLRAVRDLLGLEVSYVTRHTEAEQVLLALEGDGSRFGVGPGTRIPLAETYCHDMLEGRLPPLLPDVSAHPIAGAKGVTTAAGVGAFASVPVRLSDGSLFGTLCAAHHLPQPDLADRDLQFLHVLARIVADEFERDVALREQLWLRAQAAGADALLSAVEARDRYTGAHSREVVDLARAVALQLGLSDLEVHDVAQVALLHDIGKLSVPDAVLGKPGSLDADELAVMREHPADGARIVADIPELRHLAPAIRAEHERWDGGGYPDGLAGATIPIASRITFVCDAYHAITTTRPYRAARPAEAAVRELADGAGSQFCPRSVEALFVVLARG